MVKVFLASILTKQDPLQYLRQVFRHRYLIAFFFSLPRWVLLFGSESCADTSFLSLLLNACENDF